MIKLDKSILIILLSLLGFFITYILLLNQVKIPPGTISSMPELSGTTSFEFFFNQHPKFLMWIFLIGILISVSTGLILPVVYNIRKIILDFKVITRIVWYNTILAIVVILGVIFVGLYLEGYMLSGGELLTRLGLLLKDPQTTVLIIQSFSFVVPTIGIIGFFIINAASTNFEISLPQKIDPQQSDNYKQDFISLRNTLDFFLTVIGSIITGGIITTGALRLSVIEAVHADYSYIFPIEFVYLYGAFFTLILAILYLPIYYKIQMSGRLLIKAIQGESNEASGSFAESRNKLEEALKIKQSVQDRAKVILSILAPAIGSILPKFFE